MATVYGVNKTKIDTGPTGANILAPGLCGGKVHCIQDQYECAATAAGTIIEIGSLLPVGARVLEAIISSDNLANNTTLALGDYEDNDRYITATDHGGGSATTTRLNAADGLMYEVDATYSGTTVGAGSDRQLTITTAAGEATGTINVVVLYAID